MSQLAPEPRRHTPQPEVAVRGSPRRVHIEARPIITAVLFIAVIGSAIWYLARPEPLLVQGEAESTRIKPVDFDRLKERLRELSTLRTEEPRRSLEMTACPPAPMDPRPGST